MVKNLLFVGNAARDFVLNEADISLVDIENGNFYVDLSEPFTSGISLDRRIKITDGPMRFGHKHRTPTDISRIVKGFTNRERPGGGAYNSVEAVASSNLFGLGKELHYLDVSKQDDTIKHNLDKLDIESAFLGYREVPKNLLLRVKNDKLIAKGPILERESKMYDTDLRRVNRVVGIANGILLNSVKDESFMQHIMENKSNKKTYAVITDSIRDLNLLSDIVYPNASCIFNYDDINFLLNEDAPVSKDDRKEMAKDFLIEMKENYPNHEHYCTLGENGIYFVNGDGLFHLELKQKYKDEVNKGTYRREGSTVGAGDVTAGIIMARRVLNPQMSLENVCKDASSEAIKHIGYQGYNTREIFDFRKVA